MTSVTDENHRSLGVSGKQTRQIALYHHERWDGGGYPEGLSGEQIPMAARLMALADVFDALTCRRHYKEPVFHGDDRLDHPG